MTIATTITIKPTNLNQAKPFSLISAKPHFKPAHKSLCKIWGALHNALKAVMTAQLLCKDRKFVTKTNWPPGYQLVVSKAAFQQSLAAFCFK